MTQSLISRGSVTVFKSSPQLNGFSHNIFKYCEGNKELSRMSPLFPRDRCKGFNWLVFSKQNLEIQVSRLLNLLQIACCCTTAASAASASKDTGH